MEATGAGPALRRWDEGGRSGRRWMAAAVVAAGVVTFLPVFSNGFVAFDDGLYVTENAHVLGGLTWEGLRWAFAFPHGETYWHPLTWLSLMLDVELFGPHPWAIHGVNLLLHVGAALLLFHALGTMTGRWGRSLGVALLWTVHPLQVEAVAWAVERKTVLAGFFGFGALLAYALYVRRPGPLRMAGVAALLACGLLAKPMLITLPFLLLLLDAWPLRRAPGWESGREGGAVPAPWRRLVAEKAPLLALVAAALVLGVLTRPPPTEAVPGGLRVANALVGNWRYAAKVLWPARLALFYPQAPVAAWKAVLAAVALVASLAALLRPRLRPAQIVGVLWFLGCLVPMSGLVRGGRWPAMADRFLYLSLAGLALAVVWAAADAAEARGWSRAPALLLAAAVAAFGARANAYAREWHDSESLFRAAVASSDRAVLMRVNLGKALEARGGFDEAGEVYTELTAIAPEAPDGWVNLGALRHARGDVEGAEALYRKALQADPRCGEALYDLALLEKQRGRGAAARELVEEAMAAGFRKTVAWVQLGALYLGEGRTREAEQAFRAAWDRDEREWMAGFNLAGILAARGRNGEARATLLEARARAARNGEETSVIDRALGAVVNPAPRTAP